MRPVLFALTGAAVFAYWALGRPTFQASAAQSDWPTVLWFSASLGLLALSLAVFGRLGGRRWAARLSLVASVAFASASVANIFEDGLHLEWVFAAFVLGELVALISLMALTVVLAVTGRGIGRLLAVVPGGTALGLILFVVAGGIIMLATWVAAAAAAAQLDVSSERTLERDGAPPRATSGS